MFGAHGQCHMAAAAAGAARFDQVAAIASLTPPDATVAAEKVRLADEVGDEAVDRAGCRCRAALPTCWILPALITPIRSDMVSASSWSWVTKMKVMPVSS